MDVGAEVRAGWRSWTARRSGIRISVVVASYNAGAYVEPLIASLTSQSLPTDQFEAIIVDDGSTDDTPARFDEVAATHPHIRVIHTPNSGWPGRPRNVGMDAARGEYVYFVDADDWLAPEALERMYDMARRNDSDIVIGKIVGHGRTVPKVLFERDREQVDLATAPLMDSLTCHKMFRTAFLDRHRLRFPEGRRRLEDHLFVVEAYLRARVVSVLGSHTCYHHTRRDDGGIISSQADRPADYYRTVREAAELTLSLTEPGEVRDRVLRRWYRVEMLGRLGGRGFLAYDEDFRRELYDEVRALALDLFTSPGIWEPLAEPLQVRSTLLREGRYDELLALARAETGVQHVSRNI